MCASAAVAPEDALEAARVQVLDRGDVVVDASALGRAMASIVAQQAVEVARDRNAICYRVRLDDDPQGPWAIVKAPREGPQRTNADTTFGGEARVLAALPGAGIVAAPRLLARVAAAGRHFLFTTEVPGRHPHPSSNPFDAAQLRAILRHLLGMDRQRFMHYDLKAANILTRPRDAAFIDFEFAALSEGATPVAADAAFCEDFNVSINPLLQARSNVANFEFRSLHRYLLEMEATAPLRAAATLDLWLRGKSRYHRQMATILTAHDRDAAGASLPASGRRRSADAASFEQLLSALYRRPSDAVACIERGVMAFRCATFERDAGSAAHASLAVEHAISGDARGLRALPGAYAEAARRVLQLVSRSVHPDAAIG